MKYSKLSLMLAVASLLFVGTTAAAAERHAEPDWRVVPEQQLEQYRGGVDLGPLVASFAIQRTIEVNGVVVAQMQIVISNLDNLGNGGAPTVSISGPVAELVQIMNKSGVAAAASAAQTLAGTGASPGSAQTLAGTGVSVGGAQTLAGTGVSAGGAQTLAGMGASASGAQTFAGTGAGANATPTLAPAGASPGTVQTSAGLGAPAGSVQTPGAVTSTSLGSGTSPGTYPSASPQAASLASNTPVSGSSAVPAAAPSAAVTIVANISPSNTGGTNAGGGTASAGNTGGGVVSAGTPIVVVPATIVSSTNGPSSGLATSKTVAIGNTGQVAVLSNLPNASALTTAIQNEVHGATIQAQTTISATLNSLSSLNAVNLASQISKQVATATAGF